MVLIVGYARKFIPMTDTEALVVKVVIVLFFTVINLMGLKEVSAVSTILSILILIAFSAVTIIGFAHWEHNPVIPFTPEGQSVIDSLGGSICIAIWMYCGYECVSNMAGEIKNPEVIPKGFMIAMPLIALSYALPTIAGLASVGQWESWATDGEGAIGYMDVFIQYLGQAWGIVFLVVAIISQCAIFNAYIAAGSRGFFVMADDKLCPKFLVKVSKKRGVPYLAILLLAATTLVMMNFEFTTLMVCLAPFVIGIIGLLVNGTEYFLLGFLSIGSGVLFYLIFKWLYGGLYKLDSVKHPINPRTRLALGDTARIGAFFLAFGIYAFFGSFSLLWYEGDWGEAYYSDLYGNGLISNYYLMLDVARYGGLIAGIFGGLLIFFGRKYDK